MSESPVKSETPDGGSATGQVSYKNWGRSRGNETLTKSVPQLANENAQINQSLLTSAATQAKVDAIQAAVERLPQAELPLTHRFVPGSGSATGIYIRTIFMPAGALVISKIHRTQHPFVVTKGRCIVWQSPDREGGGITEIKAGHIGITQPGTRRIIYIYEDTEWTTFHATDKTTPEAVEADIIEPHDFDRNEALANFARINGLTDKWIKGCRSRGNETLTEINPPQTLESLIRLESPDGGSATGQVSYANHPRKP